MRMLLAVSVLLAPISAHATLAEQAAANRCFVQDVRQAFSGDFSNWVLPAFVPGTHRQAGQYQMPDCSWR